MRALHIAVAIAVLGTATVTGLAVAGSVPSEQDIPRAELAQVRAATARYHDVDAAVADGYSLLPICMQDDDPAVGGMGIHYLKGHTDTVLDPATPDALVYEVTPQGAKLVAVEYIMPLGLSNEPPVVLGMPMHENTDLGLWVLHAWVWKPNPAGMFEDFNPDVGRCPSVQ